MGERDLLALWGKTGPGDTYHPAVFHMVDVGQVASALLSPPSPNRYQQVLGRALGAGDFSVLGSWLPLVVRRKCQPSPLPATTGMLNRPS